MRIYTWWMRLIALITLMRRDVQMRKPLQNLYANEQHRRRQVNGYLAVNGIKTSGQGKDFLVKRHSTLRLHSIPLPSGARMVTCSGLIHWRCNVQVSRQKPQSHRTALFCGMVRATRQAS